MNMFKPVAAKTVEEYLATIPEEGKETFLYLHNFIQQIDPSLKPHFATNMLGYGSFTYRTSKKEELEWPIVSLANQKNHISIYVCALQDGHYIAEKYKNELGKVSVGKTCISLKKLEDIDLPTLKKVIQMAAKNPGLV